MTTDDEFGAGARYFNHMADALTQQIDALTQAQAREQRFTADVVHDLRTPVAALVSAASILSEHLDELPPDARRVAELLVCNAHRLRRLVEDVLELARLDAARTTLRLEAVDLAELAGTVVQRRPEANRWCAGTTGSSSARIGGILRSFSSTSSTTPFGTPAHR